MNIFRAFVFGLSLWTLLFAEIVIFNFGFKTVPVYVYYIIHFILLSLFTLLTSLSHFWKTDLKSSFHGLFVGLIFIIVIILFDTLLSIPLITKDFNFLIRIDRIITYIVIILLTYIVGIIKFSST